MACVCVAATRRRGDVCLGAAEIPGKLPPLCRRSGQARRGRQRDARHPERGHLPPAARRAAAARRAVQGRERARRAARRLLQDAASPSCWRSSTTGCPMLCIAGDERHLQRAQAADVHARPGLRRRARELRPARHAAGRGREEEGAPRVLVHRGAPRRAGTSSPAPRPRSGARRRPPASATSGTSARSSSRTRAASWSSRPTDGCRATSTASSSRPRSCGWRSSNRARARSARRSTSCCSTAFTTTLNRGVTAWSS